MAKKASPKRTTPKRTTRQKPPKGASAGLSKRENVIERVVEEIESRFLEGAEMATETTSAETNVALAALGAIEGPRDVKPPVRSKAAHGKRKSARPKSR